MVPELYSIWNKSVAIQCFVDSRDLNVPVHLEME